MGIALRKYPEAWPEFSENFISTLCTKIIKRTKE
jgi:hypothetical protein